MVRMRLTATLCFFVSLTWSQSMPDVGSEPSPLEAFANRPGVHTTWSGQATKLGKEETSVLVTALVLESGGTIMRGVKIELSNRYAHDAIYLGEEATERTRAALKEIADAVVHVRAQSFSGCMGAREFWPMYNWPWNKYHELNAEVCASVLTLHGRGRAGSYSLPSETPTSVADLLARAVADLKEH
jgi:hypothetical protein